MFRPTLSNFKRFFPKGKFSTAAVVNEVTTYSGGVKLFHWTMGGSLLAAVGFVLVAQNTPKEEKEKKTQLMFYHKSFGLLAITLLVPRVGVRLMSKIPGKVPGANGLEHFAANLTHLALYGAFTTLSVTGLVMGMNSGMGIPFFFTTVPSYTKNPPVAKQAFDIHKIAGQVFEYLIVLHLAGTAYHVVRGHPILRRMFPGYSSTAPAPIKTSAKV